MPLRVTTPPAGSPVTLAEAKAFCRVHDDFDDALIAELIDSATEHVEQATGLQLVAAEFQLTLRDWPRDDVIRLPRSPFMDFTSLQCRSAGAGGELVTLVEGTDFFVDENAMPPTIEPARNWPRVIDAHDAIYVTFWAGFPSEGSPIDVAANIPARAKVAVKALVAHWYENRTPVEFATPHKVPEHLNRLLNGLRVWQVR